MVLAQHGGAPVDVVQVLEAALATEDDAGRVAGLLRSERVLPRLYAAMGCLIPRASDQRLDGVKPKGRALRQALC